MNDHRPLAHLTDAEISYLWRETMDPIAWMEADHRRTAYQLEKLRIQRKQQRVRAFGRKRWLLTVLRPLVKLTARMEGRA